MHEQSLNEWIARCQQGDTAAFGQIVTLYQSQIFAYVFRLVGNEDDAKDVVQETFLRAWTYCKTYDPKFRFRTWLYTIATNCSYDYLRSKKTLVPYAEENIILLSDQLANSNLEQQLLNRNIASVIAQLTHSLTPKQKLVFTLKYLEGLETEEITVITRLTAEKVKSNLYLAKKNIKEALRKMMIYEK
ncbi:RNA polymerase sigma factor [Chitinophaga sp. XS-30]|uniref:RNA polymerase sigma factor n=1 Tax=Chitinophaga sp. XS-30 TaxID=2604421 RepID=UPI0011DE21E7|nr:sigma-70 family RNA polymerase sigma factor [Chitinophaga sp. XS-30]QEH40489.1 sigma-70 family RNA polymerase sigma factor [Chitinophaga sp. XS-30]